MLDSSALQQLKQLKTEIRREERRFEGVVAGSHGGYGFIRTEDGKQYFLPPQQMQRAFPDDRVEFRVQTDDKGRDYAELERLLGTELGEFCGRCVQHGNAWFVVADLPKLQRKLFLPPKQRRGIAPGDWLQCSVSRHPISDGRAQANVKQRIAAETDIQFPSDYSRVNFRLRKRDASPDDAEAQLQKQLEGPRQDLTALPLVSIDAPSTRDVDDALSATANGEGWTLSIAIADPASIVVANSPLDREAKARGATAYLPHFQLPMLPAALSEDLLSLVAGERRLAVVCTLEIDATGRVISSQFAEAVIRSRAQLNYAGLDACLAEAAAPPSMEQDVWQSLQELERATGKMRQWRGVHQLLMREEPEFAMVLGADGRVASFEEVGRGPARRIVEECMIAANQAVAARLASGACGLFASHAGFRTDKLGDARDLLASAGIEASAKELRTLEGYRTSIAQLAGKPQGDHLRNVLSRFLQRGALTTTPAPHLGMGVEQYATFTSPLRRYVDLINHRLLKALLHGEEITAPAPELAAHLETRQGLLRSASRWADRWLQCEYLARNTGDQWPARVVYVNSGGLVMRLAANGIEGVIDKQTLGDKVKFDARELAFTIDGQRISLDDGLQVTVSAVNAAERRINLTRCPDPAAQ